MRTNLFIIIFVLFGEILCAQSYKSQITKLYLEYSRCIADKKFDAALDYVNEDFFTYFPRKYAKHNMEQNHNREGVEFTFSEPTLSHFSTLRTIDNINYVIFISELHLKILDNNIEDADKEDMIPSLEKTYGEGNVVYDAKSKSYLCKVRKKVIASSSSSSIWKFTVIPSEKVIPYLLKFIPKEILENNP